MQAGKLRRRVTLQQATQEQNEFNEVETVWSDFAVNVPASVELITGRESFAAQQVQAEVDTKIKLRFRPGVKESMRVVHPVQGESPAEAEAEVFDILAVLPDPTGRRELTLLCKKREADGFRRG